MALPFCNPMFVLPLYAEGAVPEILAPEAVARDEGHTVMQLVLGSGPVVQGVLILLVIMSIVTWGIVFTKSFQVKKAKRQTEKFSDVFWSSRNLAQISEISAKMSASPVATVFTAGHRELSQILKGSKQEGAGGFSSLENIDRALKRAKYEEVNRLENGTTFLATTASAAPFIGLFGTVWGIMNAFIGLSHVKTSSIQAVAPGISEALIATAIGLAAAIPAAIAYNYFMQQVRVLSRSMDMFSAEFLNIARRHFLK
ncbi:MAG: protein TolQ [Bdellovibrionales bacterium]|nr:protein TolQ [Bdellovibrionales bacterium]